MPVNMIFTKNDERSILNVTMLRRQKRKNGFTIVELLIVIVVIGILAAIVIVGYNGVTKNARRVTVQADVANNQSIIEQANATGGGYPATATAAGIKTTPGNTYSYIAAFGRYCLAVTNVASAITYRVTSTDTSQLTGGCWATVSSYINNGQGTTNGSLAVAQVNVPMGLAIDANNNVYVADYGSNRIRMITAAGTVSTLAGSTNGYVNATGTSAKFKNPRGVTVDASGNVYVADSNNNAIRMIAPGGAVTTYAGSTSGTGGTTNGTGTAARFNNPYGLAVDASGNIYVADTYNHMIRKITPAKDVTTLAGQFYGYADGTGTAASFAYPNQVTVDPAGNVYVADTGNCAVRVISPAGVVSTLVGGPTCGDKDGVGTAAQIDSPSGIVYAPDGALYITDTSNQKIKRITLDGTVTTIAGSGTTGNQDGTGDVAKFYLPVGIVVDTNGNIYIGDQLNNAIRKAYE